MEMHEGCRPFAMDITDVSTFQNMIKSFFLFTHLSCLQLKFNIKGNIAETGFVKLIFANS